MYPWYREYTPDVYDFRLHDDDIKAIQYLYGQSNTLRHKYDYGQLITFRHKYLMTLTFIFRMGDGKI